MRKSKQLNIRIDPKLYEKLVNAAEKAGLTITDMVTSGIRSKIWDTNQETEAENQSQDT